MTNCANSSKVEHFPLEKAGAGVARFSSWTRSSRTQRSQFTAHLIGWAGFGRAGFDRIRHSRSQEKAALNPSGALLYRWSLRNTTRSSRDRPRETSSLTREDSTLSSQRIFLLGRVWPHQTFTVTSEGSAHALPFLPYLLMVALHHDMIIQTSSQENSTLSVHSAPSAFMPVQRGTGFTPQR